MAPHSWVHKHMPKNDLRTFCRFIAVWFVAQCVLGLAVRFLDESEGFDPGHGWIGASVVTGMAMFVAVADLLLRRRQAERARS